MRIVILKTEQNYVWTSMQEILPAIENLWLDASKDISSIVELINVDCSKPLQHKNSLFSADLIIVTAFNADIANFLAFTRKALNNLSPWIFYLHGLATFGMWPAFIFGLRDCFLKHDKFIGTCPGDQHCLAEVFEDFHYDQIPFYLLPIKEQKIELTENKINFHYMGRISPQKNIIDMIKGLALFLKIEPETTLHIFGEEDHLGHPNMGIEEKNYFKKIKLKIDELNIKDHIKFYGKVKREQLQYLLNTLNPQSNFFISCTSHSDENFGMAAFRALKSNWSCLLSSWGGHKNFLKYYKNQTTSLKLSFENGKPFVDKNEIAKKMETLVYSEKKTDHTSYFEYDHCKELALKVLNSLEKNEQVLNQTKLIKDLLERKEKHIFKKQQIFSGYEDEKANNFLKAYAKD